MALPYTSSFDKTLGFSETCAQVNLAATTVATYTLPGSIVNKYVLTFACPSDAVVYVAYNETPALPGAGLVTTQARIELMVPGMQRYAIGGDTIAFISPNASTYASVSVRSIPNPRQ